MQVSVENISDLERRLTIQLPKEDIDLKIAERIKELSRTQKLDGFRPGKVPLAVISKRFGPAVRHEVINDLMRTKLFEAITQEQLNVAGYPKIESIKDEPNEPVDFVASLEIFPTIKLHELNELSVEKMSATIDDKDVQHSIEKLRTQHSEWNPVERAATDGDRLVIDYKGIMDDKPFAGGEDKNVPITIGAGRMIPGFEEGLKGAKPGDNLTLHLKFPEKYHAEKLAGQAVDFEIVVHTVSEPHLPEIDVAFCERLGIKGGVSELQEETKKTLVKGLDHRIKNNLKSQIMDKLLTLHSFPVPNSLVAQESERLRDEFLQQLQQHGQAGQKPNLPLDLFKDRAQKRAALGLLLRELINHHQLKADPARVRTLIEDIASSYDHPQQVVSWFYHNKERMAEIESLALEEQVVDLVMQHAKVIEKPATFDEIMNPAPQAETAAE